MSQNHRQRIWAIGGGKGGVGKSLFASNFSVILAGLGRQVVAVDLDLGNANMHQCLGIRYPRKTLVEFFDSNAQDLNEYLLDTSLYNLKFISGAGGIVGSANPWHAQKLKLLRYLDKLMMDEIVLDLGAGTTLNTMDFFLAATDHIIVTTPEPISIQSAYNFIRIALFRKLHAIFDRNGRAWEIVEKAKSPTPDSPTVHVKEMLESVRPIAPESYDEFMEFRRSFHPKIVMNMVIKKEEEQLGHGLQEVIRKYLDVDASYCGHVSYDKAVRDSLSAEMPFLMNSPKSQPSGDLLNIVPSIIGNHTGTLNIKDIVNRELHRNSRVYNKRVLESDTMDVDPAIYVTDKVRKAGSPNSDREREGGGFFSIKPSTWSKIAIDIGTASTRIFVKGRGVILHEPTIMSVDENTGKVVAIGNDARAMLGRSHAGIRIVTPLESSAITNYADVKVMIQEFLKMAKKSTILIRPGVVLTLPVGLTPVEKQAVREFVRALGARETHLVYEPFAAAVGAGLPVDVPKASMLVNIGAGSTSAIVISLSGIVSQASDRVGGRTIERSIIRYLRDNNNFHIGEQTAEWVKMNYAQAIKSGRDKRCEIRGQDLASGVPGILNASTADIRAAVAKPVEKILKVVQTLLEQVPPELSGDLVDRGMTLTGGGAYLQGLDKLITETTGITVRIAPNALTAAVEGAGRILTDSEQFGRFLISSLNE